MDTVENLTIRTLSPHLLNDFLGFFEGEAFADNPQWSFCYCYFNHFPHEEMVWKERTAEANRVAACDLINTGGMQGYLAYSADKVIGWCNAGPRVNMTTLPDYTEPEEKHIGSIVCFIIARDFRRKGVARALLDAACDGFRKQGFTIAEAYPIRDAEGEKENHFGPLSLYVSAGFEHYWEDEDEMVLRKSLR